MMESKLKRIITCQGSIQMATALSVMAERDKSVRAKGVKNYLVIYDLCCQPGQVAGFTNVIRRMAEVMYGWEKITYISPEEWSELFRLKDEGRIEDVRLSLAEKTGVAVADEIYLCTNVHPTNRLFLEAYSKAVSICYGDSIGVYIPQDYVYLSRKKKAGEQGKKVSALTALLAKFKGLTDRGEGHEKGDFDMGYFLFPNIYGDKPPIRFVVPPVDNLREVFVRMMPLAEGPEAQRLLGYLRGRNTAVLMTSNFSEAGRMTIEHEIAAYREFVMGSGGSQYDVLLIKPHPRDGVEKIGCIKEVFKSDFEDVLVMQEGELAYLPFEIFLTKMLQDGGRDAAGRVTVYTVSTSFLSIRKFFNVKTIIGLGEDVVSRHFVDEYVDGRLQHEADLRRVFDSIIAEEKDTPLKKKTDRP